MTPAARKQKKSLNSKVKPDREGRKHSEERTLYWGKLGKDGRCVVVCVCVFDFETRGPRANATFSTEEKRKKTVNAT